MLHKKYTLLYTQSRKLKGTDMLFVSAPVSVVTEQMCLRHASLLPSV